MNLQLILRANKPKFSLQCRRMKELSINLWKSLSYSDLIQFTNLQNQCWPTNPTKNFVKEPITPENLVIFVKRCLPTSEEVLCLLHYFCDRNTLSTAECLIA